MSIKRTDFPEDFIFGTATSAFQIEGAALSDGRTHSIWDTFALNPKNTKDGANGNIACNHYNLYKSDLNLIKNMGMSAYRFSISWSRAMADHKGTINQKGVDFYDKLIDSMLSKGIDPYITLYHWDLPNFMEDRGGWQNRDTAKSFQEYSYKMAEKFGDRVSKWITHNEMWCTSIMGYFYGVFAPGIKDMQQALTVAHHVLLSHGYAIQAMRESSHNLELGIAPNYLPCYPATDKEEDILASDIFDGFFNRWFLDPLTGRGYPSDMLERYKDVLPPIVPGDLDTISEKIDFLGVNYYNSNWYVNDGTNNYTPCEKKQPEGLWHTADRDVYARGLYDTLDTLANEYKFTNIYVTENGAAFHDKVEFDENGNEAVHDKGRIRFIEEHFEAARDAIKDGIPLKGFFVWSLMDNFEWAEGYTIRYGLHYTDYKSQKRIPKDSAKWLKSFLC